LAAGFAPAQQPTLPPPPLPAKTHKAKPHDQFADAQAPVQQVQYGAAGAADATAGEYQYLVEPPGPEKLFGKLDSEADFYERLRQEWRDLGHRDRLPFPEEPVISTDQYLGRAWPQYNVTAEPSFVCYQRLLFEQPNYERYGWDMGIIDPPLSAGKFFLDVAALPYHAFTDPCRCYECSAGYCLPGDPVPLLLYPPEASLTGAVAEASAVLTVLAVFP
jgi:hypothetical protein